MTSIGEKADYVRERMNGPPGTHTCHWPGCVKRVPAAVWGCRPHWFSLPRHLRTKIWSAFRPGQEVSKTPSAAYLEAAREVQEWISNQEKKP